MSQTPSEYEAAVDAILRSGSAPEDVAAALRDVSQQIALLRADKNIIAWSKGCRGDGAAHVTGLTDTTLGLLRRLAAKGVETHEAFPELSRYACQLRKALKIIAPDVRIETVPRVGYRLVAGFESVYRLLGGGRTSALPLDGFTPKETQILRLFVEWGNLHKEQVHCLVRHMSNIRTKLKAIGIAIDTAGDGLYIAERAARSNLKRLLAGEITVATRARGKPELKLVAA